MKGGLAILLLAGLVLSVAIFSPQATPPVEPVPVAEDMPDPDRDAGWQTSGEPPAPARGHDVVVERERSPLNVRGDDEVAVPIPSPQAVAALRESMRHGDARTPPLAPATDLRAPPSAKELADPALYQQYEQRQRQNVYASFAHAADRRIPELEALIAQGKAKGLSERQLAEGESKLAKLREQRDQLAAQQSSLAEGVSDDGQD